MDDRLDLSPTPRMARITPAARLAHELLRTTLIAGGATSMLDGLPSLVVVHGLRPSDAKTMDAAAQDFEGGSGVLELVTRDWTDPDKLRDDHLRRLLLEASTTRRAILVLCRRRSSVPAVLATVADAVLPLHDRRALLPEFVEELAEFVPDEALVTRLTRLPLPYLNLLLRPGMTRERMFTLAGRLHRLVVGEPDRGDGKATQGRKARDRRKDQSAAGATPVPADTRFDRLEDLPGMAEAGLWGLALAADLADHRAGNLPWCHIESGAVLHGPPGTGKTLFARALAGSCGLPLHAHSVAAWQAKGHLGDLLRAMRAAFDEARKSAPAILFIDELDSVGSRDEPHGDNASYQRQVVNGLLECLDGAVGREGIVVVGATNNLGAIDRAVLRPGRLGRLLEVPLPDLEGRVGILRRHLHGDLVDADLPALADEIGEASGATLAQLVREARGLARRERRGIRADDLWEALPKGVLLCEEAFRRMCVHEAGHLVVGMELAPTSGLVPTGASVRRRPRTGGANRTDFRLVEGFDQTRASVEANMMVLLAGIAAEEVLLGTRGGGSGGSRDADLARATQLAVQAERSLGLGTSLFTVHVGSPDLALGLAREDADLRQRVERMMADCLREARLVVERKREEIEGVAKCLAERGDIRLS